MNTNALGQLSPDAFLKLFVTQLKHQDPTNPADPGKMMTELAQMSTVQKLEQLGQSFTAALKTEQMGLATGMIGAQVLYANGDGLSMGIVQAAETSSGTIGVRVNNTFVPLDKIQQVTAAQVA